MPSYRSVWASILAGSLAVVVPASAVAGTSAAQTRHEAHPVRPLAGKVYSGRVTEANPLGGGFAHPKITFKVAGNGRTMRMLGQTRFYYSCSGGGGGPVVGRDVPSPLMRIRRNGMFGGSSSSHSPGGTTRYGFTGRFLSNELTATGYFWLKPPIGSHCSSNPSFRVRTER